MWQANWLFSGIKGDGMKKTVKTVKKEYAIWIFVLLVFVFYLSWALAAPFDASPDESMRYQIVEFIVKHGTLPDGRDPEIRNANWGISYAFNQFFLIWQEQYLQRLCRYLRTVFGLR